MPIFEYECTKCEHVFEEFSGPKTGKESMVITDEPNCPKCNADVKKIISSSTFRLKGSGWSSDGYSSQK